ncbi:hypothetical protein B0T20DRAFT_26059 [Sordaria brevicollis]|uniref:BZIP domain-containing protein n=1 Tax=Sordaria brevicollis TaxID=83679 RepID=A0AAE0PNR9_SORBR|nr:hypothetical protein B0T20DRAFT_26059 [Sordaria brevicollis]
MSSSNPSAHPYALPDLTEVKLSVEDDWTKVKDRKEKKRIQNRVAQRTYRNRMKARIGELQQKLEYHERNKGTSTNGDSPNGDGANGQDTNRSPSVQLPTPTYTTDNSPSPRPDEESVMFEDIHWHNYHDPHALHADATQLFDLLPVTTPSNTPPSGVFSARHSSITDSGYTSTAVQEYLRLRMESFDNQHHPAGLQAHNYDLGLSARSGDSLLVHDTPDIDPLLFSSDGLDMSVGYAKEDDEGHLSNWRHQSTETINPDRVAVSPAVPLDLSNSRKSKTCDLTIITKPSKISHKAPPHTASLPTKRPTLDERVESVMERVETAGFDSFDSLATLYYNAKFGDSSSLAVEQRLSRNRRLPKLFADVFSAAQDWGPWEQRPLFDEVLRMSESMLIGEARGVHSTLHASIGGLARSAKDEQTAKSAIPGLKRLMESNLPNLWAQMTALATENRAVRQRDRSNTVLATILVLQCSGQIPKESLMALLDACL